MAKKKNGRPPWFKMFGRHKSLVEAVSDEAAGRAFKAMHRYFHGDELPDLDPLASAVFAAMKPDIDAAFADFQAASEKNRQNVRKRWANRGIPSDTTGNNSLPSDTEGEVELNSTSSVNISAAPGLEAGEQGKVYFDESMGEWRQCT